MENVSKTIWVNSTGKQFSIDRHEGIDGKRPYLMVTEHNDHGRGKRYRISIPLPLVERLIEALHEASQ